MNAALLLDHYAGIADAPDAIARLRRFVLDLAVRGKLVEQDAGDEPASELLARIKVSAVDIQKRRGRARDTSSGNALQDIPFEAPKGWTFASLGELVRVLNGRAYKQQELLDKGTPVLRVGNLFTSNHWYYSDLALDDDKHCDAGDLIYAWSASFGPFIWNGPRVIYHYHIWKLPLVSEADLDKHYLYNFLLQKTREIKEAGHGISMVHMTKEKMEKLVVPLPPLAEQHRIVAKVDALMALCDQLEAARATREAARDTFTLSTLAKLNTPDPETFGQDARFALTNFAPLTTRADQIKQLRQTVLNLAVRGELVAQDAADEPASELLRHLRRGKPLPVRKSVSLDDGHFANAPFNIPSSWEWTTVQNVLDTKREISYGVIKLGDEPKNGGIPTLRCSDVRPGFIVLSTVRRVREDIEADYARTRLSGGEIVINIRGTLGGVAVVPPQLKGYNVAREVAVVPIASDIPGAFMMHLMLSPYFWNHIEQNLRGIAYKGLNLGILRELPIPIPPLAEQHRIVAKVGELMALCDQLEASLTTGEQTRSRLLEAVLHNALEPA